MKGLLYSQDGSYAFALGPKVTTIGRENCDISINSPHVDHQHALIEYDDEQRTFILKDLNSTSGTFVHECRVQNAAVRLADGDFVRFGFNGLPLEFRVEQHETAMPSIYSRPTTNNALHVISQTIPSRRSSSNTSNYPQQLDVRQNPGFTLRSRPVSAGAKKTPNLSVLSHDARGNAWTTNGPINPNQSIITGSFIGEVDVAGPDTSELNNRVGQLEREVKGRDNEIRQLTDRLRNLEPMNSTVSHEVQSLRTELDKVRREKQAASGLISSLQRDLHSKESSLTKLGREVDGLKTDSRDKDLRLQSLQGKLNLLRDRTRAEEDRHNKEKDAKIKAGEQQIAELTENVQRLKGQIQEMEKQLSKLHQTEGKLKQECEQLRGQLTETQRSEATLQTELANAQRQNRQFCVDIWRCFSSDDEYDDDEQSIIEQIRQLQRQLEETRTDFRQEQSAQTSSKEYLRLTCRQLVQILSNATQEQTSISLLQRAREQIEQFEPTMDEDHPFTSLKQTIRRTIDNQLRWVSDLRSLVDNDDEEEEDLTLNETLRAIRRQFDELRREKEHLTDQLALREQTLRAEQDHAVAEKETSWQERFNDECDRLRQQNAQLQSELDDQTRSFTDRLETISRENSEYLQRWTELQNETREKIDQLTEKIRNYEQNLSEERDENNRLTEINEQQKERLSSMEKNHHETIGDLSGQTDVFKDQVRQFSNTIVQLEKKVQDEQEKRIRAQAELDQLQNQLRTATPVQLVEAVVPILPAPAVAELSQELFAWKARVQEQEQIIVSLRRDLSGMTARLSDLQGELTEKQKRTLEKSEATVREQSKELNDTRLKLARLSDIVDKQTTQIDTLQTDLSKSKVLADQYQLLVNQRQGEIDRLTKSLEQKDSIVERVEKNNHDEGRITHELVAIGAQCKGERHELTIGRQREALNELRARIKSLEQLRPANPSYEKVLQQVVLLKRELAELRARQALPTDIPYLMNNGTSPHSSQKPPTTTLRQSPSGSMPSEVNPEGQQMMEERTAHAEALNSLQSCDDLHTTFTRKLVQLLEIDDDSLLNVTPLATTPSADRYVALQQRQRTIEILLQKIGMLRERLLRKEDLLRDYEKDLGKLRQAEILLREKDILLQDIETEKRSKEDESLFLRNTLRETQDHLNQEKRMNSSIKLGRNVDQTPSSELIRRSGNSTGTLHHHCPPDATGKVRTIKRTMNEKLVRKDYEIKTLKQELNEALDKASDQSQQVKLFQLQSRTSTDDLRPAPH